MEKEIASLKPNSDHCPLCQSRKDVKIAIDAINTTEKLADNLNKELKAKCEKLEASLKTHKEVVDHLHKLLLESKRKTENYMSSIKFNLKNFKLHVEDSIDQMHAEAAKKISEAFRLGRNPQKKPAAKKQKPQNQDSADDLYELQEANPKPIEITKNITVMCRIRP